MREWLLRTLSSAAWGVRLFFLFPLINPLSISHPFPSHSSAPKLPTFTLPLRDSGYMYLCIFASRVSQFNSLHIIVMNEMDVQWMKSTEHLSYYWVQLHIQLSPPSLSICHSHSIPESSLFLALGSEWHPSSVRLTGTPRWWLHIACRNCNGL